MNHGYHETCLDLYCYFCWNSRNSGCFLFDALCSIPVVLKGPGVVQGKGVFLGNPEDSVWEDWGTLGKTRGITLKNPTI